ncbi:MAG: 23S rRNA (adenine(2503)-C(2))-methyltransferase [Zetaproteobacteria bacterium CG2_30_46_52]|nr:MAG: 23S rRNA (adenine(2503)-C(2))-methyltransferase [Zetaproteobacteria bacterium CG2_30_46_52]
MIAKQSLLDFDRQQLADVCQSIDVPTSHANTIYGKVFRYGQLDVENTVNVPKKLLAWLDENTEIHLPEIISQQQSEDNTQKLLLRMDDKRDVESVIIPGAGRITQCISSQVGCAIGCEFCLTATGGLTRNLTTAEMMSEVFIAHRVLGEYPRNLVLMGMGEPLHNYEHVAKFVRMVTDERGMAFSPRRVTISTAGLVPAIYRMLEDDLPCSLAISLNATTNEVRNQIMPINLKYPLESLLKAMQDYVAVRNRKRILVEYVLLAGINDSEEDAKRLVDLVKPLNSTVNVLPFNPFPGSKYQRPSDEVVDMFSKHLNDAGLVAVIRRSKGREISAACGQLKTEVNERAVQLLAKRSAKA